MTKEEFELVDQIIAIVEEVARLKAENTALRRMVDMLKKENGEKTLRPL